MMIEDLGTMLQGLGHGTLAIDLFLYQLPDEPDECVGLRIYEGPEPEFSHNANMPTYERPRFQMTVRKITVSAAMATAQSIWLDLMNVRNMAIGGTRYIAIHPLQSPFILERDENNRWVAGANFEVWKEV